jgi:hypothetical protein
MKIGIKLRKVEKFEIGWCISHIEVADNASNRVKCQAFREFSKSIRNCPVIKQNVLSLSTPPIYDGGIPL